MIIHKKQARMKRGFTLTEAAIVLGIVGLILGAIWVAASSVYSNMRVTTASKQLMTVVQNVRSLYSSSTTMGVLAATDLVKAGIFPADTNPSAVTGLGTNGWGGAITGARVAGGANGCAVDGSCFTVNFGTLPQDACVKFAVGNSGQGKDGGLVGAADVEKDDGASYVGAAATPANFIAHGCSSAAASNVMFTFKLKG